DALYSCGDDKVIPQIVWQNLHPLLENRADTFLGLLAARQKALGHNPIVLALMPRVAERILGRYRFEPATVDKLFAMLTVGPFADASAARACMTTLTTRIHNGEVTGANLRALAEKVKPRLAHVMGSKAAGHFFPDSHLLAATLGDPATLEYVRNEFAA